MTKYAPHTPQVLVVTLTADQLEAMISSAVEAALLRSGIRFEQAQHRLMELYGERMTVAEIQKELKVSKRTVHNMRERGELPTPVRIGKNATFPTGAVIKIIESKSE